MTPTEFIATQPKERQKLLTQLHEIIIQNDTTVTPVVTPMMGKEMINYNAPGSFKYALASGKGQMSLHVLPMNLCTELYEKYSGLLKEATFQKGCINFKKGKEMPLAIVRDLIADCSQIDLQAIRQKQLKSKSTKA